MSEAIKDLYEGGICWVLEEFKAKYDDEELNLEYGKVVKISKIAESWIKIQKCCIAPVSVEKAQSQLDTHWKVSRYDNNTGDVPKQHLAQLYEVIKESGQASVDVGDLIIINKCDNSNITGKIIFKKNDELSNRQNNKIKKSMSDYPSCQLPKNLVKPLIISSGEEVIPRVSSFTVPPSCGEIVQKIFSVSKFHWKEILTILVVIVGLFYFNRFESSNPQHNLEAILNSNLKKLLEENPVIAKSDEPTLYYCLEQVALKRKPCVFLLLNGGKENFSGLLFKIGDIGVRILNDVNGNSDAEIIELSASKLVRYPNGDGFFKENKDKLEKNKVMIVNEMEKIPADIMEKFHSLCDVHDPAVTQAVIIFLLNYNPTGTDPLSNDHTLAYKILSELWKGSIPHDLIIPLVTRVTENVINLENKIEKKNVMLK